MSSDSSPPDIDLDNSPQSASTAGHGKRETLTSRARRIIGRALETPKDNNVASSSSAGPTHKGPPKKAPTKRREQVLAAQRTHRQRTQGYIKELEKEVLRIRDSESRVKRENERLLKNAQLIELYMTQNNLPFPEGYLVSSAIDNSSSPTQSVEGSINFTTSSNGITSPSKFTSDTEISPTYSPWGNISPSTNVNVDFANLLSLDPVKPEPKDIQQFESAVEYHTPKTTLRPQRSTDRPNLITCDSQMALDFVIDLERVCFPHIKQQYLVDNLEKNPDIPDENFGPNHVYMATSNLLNHQIRQAPIKNDAQTIEVNGLHQHNLISGVNHPFSLPVIDLDSLLATSLAVNFGTDVTPIQIWANIGRLANKGWIINKDILAAFAEELHQYMRCNGYGAVAETAIVKQIFAHFFPGEEYLDLYPSQAV